MIDSILHPFSAAVKSAEMRIYVNNGSYNVQWAMLVVVFVSELLSCADTEVSVGARPSCPSTAIGIRLDAERKEQGIRRTMTRYGMISSEDDEAAYGRTIRPSRC